MSNRRQAGLDAAFRDTPDMCRQAVLQAVSTYQEEKKMKRPVMMVVAVVLILALLGGTALALVNYYSVRDAVAKGKPSQAFEESIIDLENSQTSQGITVTLGDAVFDGSHLDFTVQLSAAENAEPVLVVPAMKCVCQGAPMEIDYHAERLVSLSEGFFYPSSDPQYPSREAFTVSAEYSGVQSKDAVEWQYTLYLFKPKWEIVQASQAGDWEAYKASFLEAYRQGKIMAEYGMGIDTYADAVAGVVLPEDHVFKENFVVDTMRASGAFEELEAMTFTFSTAMPEVRQVTGEDVFHFDGYDIRVRQITASFMRVNYELEISLDAPFAHEHELAFYYDLFDQNGNELAWKSSGLSGTEDHTKARIYGSVEYISDEPLTAITFKPSRLFSEDQTRPDDESLWFTVNLRKQER